MDFFKSFFDFTKLPTKIFLVLSIATGVFIFSDSEILKKLHLDKFEQYGGYIGLTFLFSTVLVSVNFVIWGYQKINYKILNNQAKKEFNSILKQLDPKEKAVLREFAIQQQNSVKMPYDDTVVSGLIDKGILRYNKQFGNGFITNGTKVSLTISNYVSKIIKPEHLDLKEDLTEEEQYQFLEKRPNWVNDRWY